MAQLMTVNDTIIYYDVAGKISEGTLIVLLHAGITDSTMWDAQWADFAQQFGVIRYDRPGFGKSQAVSGVRANRADLLALLDQLQFQQAHLVGCSMGGELIVDFALQYPERVKSLTVVSSVVSGFQMQGEPPKELGEFLAALQTGDVEQATRFSNQMYVVGAQRQPDEVDSDLLQNVADMTKVIIKNGAIMQPDAEPLDLPAMQRLSELKMPVLLVAGGLDHPEILRGVDVLEAEIENVRKVIISDTAHFPNMEKPDEFNRVVLNFLSVV